MKIAYFELMVELENKLEKKLIQSYGPEYSLLLNPEGNSLTLLENGQIEYNCIEIYINGDKHTTKQNEKEFWSIVNKLEEVEKINDMFSDLEKNMREISPHLFIEEIEFPKKYKAVTEYIFTTIFITLIGVVFLLLKFL